MRIELITSADRLDGTPYYEFVPGEFGRKHWGRPSPQDSVYIDDEALSLVRHVFFDGIPEFDPYGPNTISGSRIRSLAESLRDFAKTVGHAREPGQVWNRAGQPYGLDSIDDWETAKQQLCLMLRDLDRWLLAVERRKEPVSILGI